MIDNKRFQEFSEILEDKMGVELTSIKPEQHITEDLGADSLDVVELIMAVESEYDISIPDEDAEKMTTVESCVNYIISRVGE